MLIHHLLTFCFSFHSNEYEKVLDSTAQLPDGIIQNEHYHAEGLFDECLSIRSVPQRIAGQYCTVFFKMAPVDLSQIDYEDDDSHHHPLLSTKDLPTNGASSSPMLIVDMLHRLLGSPVEDAVKVKPKHIDKDPWMLYRNYPSFSLCLPSSCSASDLGESFSHLIGKYVIANQSIVTVADEHFCFSEDRSSYSFDGLDITAT